MSSPHPSRLPSARRLPRHAYVLVARGPDGRVRLERFDEPGAYKARLLTLSESPGRSVSIDDIVDLLDT